MTTALGGWPQAGSPAAVACRRRRPGWWPWPAGRAEEARQWRLQQPDEEMAQGSTRRRAQPSPWPAGSSRGDELAAGHNQWQRQQELREGENRA